MYGRFKWNFQSFQDTFRERANGSYLYLVECLLGDLGILHTDMKEGPWLAGGTLRRMFEGQLYFGADFDFFFKNEEQKRDFRKRMDDSWEIERVFESANASTYKMFYEGKMVTIQLIHRKYYDMPSKVIEDFDIIACQLITNGITVVHGALTFDHIEKRLLRINPLVLTRDTYSANHTLRRMIKMGEDGYRMGSWHVNEYLKYIVAHPEVVKDEKPMSPEVAVEDTDVF